MAKHIVNQHYLLRENVHITTEDESLILNHFPEAKIEIINNSGHWVHAENPDAFYAKIMKFI